MQAVCDAPSGRGGTWNKDGVIVFTPDASVGGGLTASSHQVEISRRSATRTGNVANTAIAGPYFFPTESIPVSGKQFLWAERRGRHLRGFTGFQRKAVRRGSHCERGLCRAGYLLFYREKTLLAQRFDQKRFVLTGEPTAILTDIQYLPQVARAMFTVSDNGLMITQSGSGVALSQPVWFDRKGNEVGRVGKPDVYLNVALAPNGNQWP